MLIQQSTAQSLELPVSTDDESMLRRAGELDPNDVWAFYGLGSIYGRRGQAGAATAEFIHCLDLDPQFLPARVQLAALYYETANYPACIEEYRTAIAVGGINEQLLTDLYFGLGDAYRANGDYEHALDSYRQAISVVQLAVDRTRH